MIYHNSDLNLVNKWVADNSADPLYADLTETVSKRRSVSLLLENLKDFYPFIKQTEKVQGHTYLFRRSTTEDITSDGLWEMKQIKEFSFDLPDDVREVYISTWKPGAIIKPHRGPFKGLIRLHIGLLVPAGDCWLSINETKYFWKEKVPFCFDDTFIHYGRNHTNKVRSVLFVNLERKMNSEGNQLAIRKMLNENMYS